MLSITIGNSRRLPPPNHFSDRGSFATVSFGRHFSVLVWQKSRACHWRSQLSERRRDLGADTMRQLCRNNGARVTAPNRIWLEQSQIAETTHAWLVLPIMRESPVSFVNDRRNVRLVQFWPKSPDPGLHTQKLAKQRQKVANYRRKRAFCHRVTPKPTQINSNTRLGS